MFLQFYYGIQQDFKLMLVAPLVCALFRLAFILVYAPNKNPRGHWKKWLMCFSYGFWWGMDFNAYVFLFSLVLVSLLGAFFPGYYALGDEVRCYGLLGYLAVIYTAFMGKMIFYYHFHDTYNVTIKLGGKADKKNLLDIFFHQNHGALILLGYLPYLWLCHKAITWLLSLPLLPYWTLAERWQQYGLNAFVFISAGIVFYWFRYGGTLNHRHKPEFDEVPDVVKNDIFFGKAVVDDLVAFELACKKKVSASLTHDDDTSAHLMQPLLGRIITVSDSPLQYFRRQAKGARISKPSHIFFLLGESHTQVGLDSLYANLHLMDASKKFRENPHTIAINNFLSAGMTSRPSLVSLLSGVYDANLQLNERELFWHKTVSTALPLQMKKLGYRTEFWYGGGLNHGSMQHFVPATGFDACHAGPDICGKKAPATWLGVYDHIFLARAAELIAAADEGPTLHFLYTTSNHGPWRMPFCKYGFDADRIMPDIPKALRRDAKVMRKLAAAWYADQALLKFVCDMQKVFPDSLFILTGDHSAGLIPYQYDLVNRREPSMRECVMTTFAIHHPELMPGGLAGNTIGGHMNILPTLVELIAPQGYEYESLFPSLTEPIDHVVTPYCWLTKERVGDYSLGSQSLAVSSDMLPLQREDRSFAEERAAYCEITGWLVRHPEQLMKGFPEV
ncbi:LTA synthase family protein [Selenomonas ruminantium]|uniref:LTA synthase family protein n=1 Tax=Selenomonas ruminantium TaxID=971 RepID=UPI000942E56E|nr:sulfatase-like hydrolase/transferase [Selenomonas ruminantium]